MRNKARRAALAFVLLLIGVSVCEAAPILYTSRSAFNAAVQPNHDLVFDADFTDCTFIGSGTCVHTFDDLLTVGYDVAGIGLLGDSLGLGPWGGQSSGARFLEPVIAVGFDLVAIPTPPRTIVNPDGSITIDSSPQPAQFHYAGSSFGVPAAGIGLPLFFGAIFDAPTTSLPAFATVNYATNHGGTVGFAIKDMSVRTVPEPSTLYLAAAGILLFVARRRSSAR
jgi:hypothetical protein